MTGDHHLADDLLQEAYYRFLRTANRGSHGPHGAWESEAHRRAYLFRIATNLVRDLARDLALPVVIAAPPGLGAINHTLLTIEAVRNSGLAIASVVLRAELPWLIWAFWP